MDKGGGHPPPPLLNSMDYCLLLLCGWHMTKSGRATAAITSLHVYPVKACAGHKLEKATLGARGLEMDRLWMIVDGNGRFMSQRRCPKMALIKPSLPKTMDEVKRDKVNK